MIQKLEAGKIPEIAYCIPLWLRNQQIKSACVRDIPRLKPTDELRKDSVAVVCYGPSLADTWEKIKEFKYVITGSGSHKFLVDRGILPTWHVDVDPRPHKVKLMGIPCKETEYLIASTCHPSLFDHLNGYNVKLWHIFDGEAEGMRLLPAGEWAFTGGCSVGLRSMALARILGFTELHIFGMDGCEGKTGKHAAAHPNQAKTQAPVEYKGKTYITTAGFLAAAQQTFHELDHMLDVKATFYGEGLVQDMAKDYVPNREKKTNIILGISKPELISAQHLELNTTLHRDVPEYGVGGIQYENLVKKLVLTLKGEGGLPVSVLDYGAGKGTLASLLPFPIWEYDPAFPNKAESPRPADFVCCFDVLEHIEPEKLVFVLNDLQRCVKQLGYFVICFIPAAKTYSDGRNTHLIQEGKEWWEGLLKEFFTVGRVFEAPHKQLHIIVGPLANKNQTPNLEKYIKSSSVEMGTEVRAKTGQHILANAIA
jgi:uncharacterized Rossmann fold enzyme